MTGGPKTDVAWVLQKITQLTDHLTIRSFIENETMWKQGYDEDTSVLFLTTNMGDFVLQLESLQFTNISKVEQAKR